MFSSLNSVISTNERNGILTDHVIFKLRYNEIYQMKTTIVSQSKLGHPKIAHCPKMALIGIGRPT